MTAGSNYFPAHGLSGDELRQIIEYHETLTAEKADISTQQKELLAQAKGRGYDVKAIRKVIALRKLDPSDLAEQEAVVDTYRNILGM